MRGQDEVPYRDGKVKISYQEIWKFSFDTLPEKIRFSKSDYSDL
jgi:hypothetical protein